MSIKIHHGPPGSYKTSGAVMDDFIPAARAGRCVVTNVRGLCDIERIREALGDDTIPDTFDLHYLPTSEHADSAANREALARWWHWLPHGAFLLLDEAQMIWPKTWTQKDLDGLNFDGGLEAANAANRPFNWQTAFEMHRHYGWDMVLTTPNIDRLRPDVRQCAEGAYKHKNQAIIGLKGFYLEAFHMADDSGKSASDFLTLRNRRIKPEVWKLYASTATGAHSDTIAGLSLLANPRILLLLGALSLALLWFIQSGPPAVMGGKSRLAPVAPAAAPAGSAPAPSGPAAPAPAPVATVPAAAPNPPHVPIPAPTGKNALGLDLLKAGFHLVGRYGPSNKPRFLFETADKSHVQHFHDDELNALGITVEIIGRCHVRLTVADEQRLISCKPRPLRSAPSGGDDVGGATRTAQASILK